MFSPFLFCVVLMRLVLHSCFMQPMLWFRFFKKTFSGNEPRYFDVTEKEWCIDIEQNFTVLQKEIMQFVETDIHRLKDYRFHITDGKPQWQTFPLMSWGYVHSKNINHLPYTWRVFKKIKGLSSVSVSRLLAGVTIPAHHGDTNAVYRCHFGIKIPADTGACFFVVGDEARAWQEGKVLAFCDAQHHYAQNSTHEDRYVILFDVVREDFLSRYYRVCSTVIATHVLHAIGFRFTWFERLPFAVHKILLLPVAVGANLFLRLQNLFSKN
jgi:ornithine lipid ester-linked acyl 2-hydroxylase